METKKTLSEEPELPLLKITIEASVINDSQVEFRAVAYFGNERYRSEGNTPEEAIRKLKEENQLALLANEKNEIIPIGVFNNYGAGDLEEQGKLSINWLFANGKPGVETVELSRIEIPWDKAEINYEVDGLKGEVKGNSWSEVLNKLSPEILEKGDYRFKNEKGEIIRTPNGSISMMQGTFPYMGITTVKKNLIKDRLTELGILHEDTSS